MPHPTERREPRIEFLGEQDGPPERELKSLLRIELPRLNAIKRAYLARIGFSPGAAPSVALCLVGTSADTRTIAEYIGELFASQFSKDAHLDIVFIDSEQEGDLRRVCLPFYEAPV